MVRNTDNACHTESPPKGTSPGAEIAAKVSMSVAGDCSHPESLRVNLTRNRVIPRRERLARRCMSTTGSSGELTIRRKCDNLRVRNNGEGNTFPCSPWPCFERRPVGVICKRQSGGSRN